MTRREVLRIVAAAGAGIAIGQTGCVRSAAKVERSQVLMGTYVRLTILGDDREAAAAAAEATLHRMSELEALLSRYVDSSEVSRLAARGRIDGASDALLDVLRIAQRVSELGEGAFDVTVQPLLDLYRAGLPADREIELAMERVGHRALRLEGRSVTLDRPGMRLTLDGVGKGYVVDEGVSLLKRHGFPSVFVDAGGDLVASGSKSAGRPWRIGIRNPRPGLALHARFDVRDRAVATSGDYMQPFTPDFAQHHIVDPRTGRSAPGLASATVIAPDAATADALATLAMVLGPRRGRELLEDLPEAEGYLVTKELEAVRTSGFALL